MSRREGHERDIVCVDFDGTLCRDAYPEIGLPRAETLDLVRRLHLVGYEVIVASSRRSLDYRRLADWLAAHEVPYDQLCLGTKPVADLYLDDKGLLPSPRLAEALLERRFSSSRGYLEDLAAERLSSAFAENIYDVPEAREGPPERTPGAAGGDVKRAAAARFTILLAMTGGMDSTTLWRMLEEAGSPYRMVYVEMGQPYAAAERAAIRAVTGRDPDEVVTLGDLGFVRHHHILAGRNAILLWELARLLCERDGGGWGELWFGNLAGESPVAGGDKSRRFFNDMQALLTLEGYDARIVTPLLGLTKTDEVCYWRARGEIATLKKTRSCFSSEGVEQCGRCQACFLKWAAFTAAGEDCSDCFPAGTQFAEHVAKYRRVLGEALSRSDFSHYSPGRIIQTLSAIAMYERMHGGDPHS